MYAFVQQLNKSTNVLFFFPPTTMFSFLFLFSFCVPCSVFLISNKIYKRVFMSTQNRRAGISFYSNTAQWWEKQNNERRKCLMTKKSLFLKTKIKNLPYLICRLLSPSCPHHFLHRTLIIIKIIHHHLHHTLLLPHQHQHQQHSQLLLS